MFCSKIIWFTTMRCMFIATRIWVKKSAVIVHSTSTESDGSNGFPAAIASCCILMIGGMPCRMFISIGKAIETCAPAFWTAFQPMSDCPVMWMNRLSGPIPIVADAAIALGELVQGRGDAEWREDVRRNLETELLARWSRTCRWSHPQGRPRRP